LALCASAIGHVLDNWDVLRPFAEHASLITWMLSATGPGLFWAFTMTLFDDHFGWRLVVLPVAALALSLLGGFAGPSAQWFSLAYNMLSAALVAHALYVIWTGRRGDLVEPRRALRTPILVAASLYVLAIAASGIGRALGFATELSSLALITVLATMAVAASITLLRVDPAVLGAVASMSLGDTRGRQLSPTERAALDRLRTAMTKQEVWRREDLSIGGLAVELSLPEHRLRRLINGELGYRNFAAFINANRVEAAKVELSDPARASKTVASIAFDLGFGSLGPFNRAFKQATGVTPSTWRKGQRASPNGKNPLRI